MAALQSAADRHPRAFGAVGCWRDIGTADGRKKDETPLAATAKAITRATHVRQQSVDLEKHALYICAVLSVRESNPKMTYFLT